MDKDVAVIGMAGRFPEAETIEQLYENLRLGRDSIRDISIERRIRTSLPLEAVYKPVGYIEDIDLFDHGFFNISLGEAQNMAPQQRLVLEVVYQAMENAGYSADHFSGTRAAIFIGDTRIEYYRHAKTYEPTMFMGNHVSAIAGRVARFFNLAGTAAMVDSSCSSSLVALHLAVNELLLGDADYALACGVNLNLFPDRAAGEYDIGIKSPDGKTRCFAADAAGTGSGEAVIAVLLKPLRRSLADRDHIHAVIKSVAVNQVAARSPNLTAPDAVSQSEVIRSAWKKAQIDPSSVAYIEAHGTATKLGDPIEVEGLDLAFRETTHAKGFCAISSIKSNFGHTWSAAGLAGFVKATLAVKHGVLFPSVNCQETSPLIDFANSAVRVNRDLQPWSNNGAPRRAGVSSFGIMGTNAHCVLEQAATREPRERSVEARYWAPVSAKSRESLQENMAAILRHLDSHPDLHCADISYTLIAGRKHYPFRFATVFRTLEQLKASLESALDGGAAGTPQPPDRVQRLVLVFSGASGFEPELVERIGGSYPLFRQDFEQSLRQAGGHGGHPAVYRFSAQLALYRLLLARGVETAYMLGDGVGKSVTAVISGRMSMEQAIADAIAQEPCEAAALDRRIAALLQSDAHHGRIVYAEPGPPGNISRALLERMDEAASFGVVAVREHGCISSYLADLYAAGADLNFEHAASPGDRIELPAYQFRKVRCWMETGDANDLDLHASNAVEVAEPSPGVADQVRRIWSEVLKTSGISDSDSFFDLGGHSINAVQVLNRIEDEIGISLSTESIFEFDTVATLSACIVKLLSQTAGRAGTIPRAPAQEDYRLSFRQRRIWLASQFRQGSVAYNLHRAFRLSGAIDIAALERALAALMERHETLRMAFPLREGEPRQSVPPAERFRLKLEVKERERESWEQKDLDRLVLEFASASFDLEQGPLFRAMLIKLGDDDAIFSFATHHLVCDGWSLSLLVRDLTALYEAFRLQKPPDLPPLPISYKDFAEWECAALDRGEFAESEAYWVKKLEGVSSLELPFQKRRSAGTRFSGQYRNYQLGAELYRTLKAFAIASDATMFVVMLSTFNVLLARYTDGQDIVVGTSLAGRDDKALEELIGMFVNTIPIRTRVDLEKSFRAFVNQVRQEVWEGLSHQRYPFSHLDEKRVAVGQAGAASLFDLLIEFQQFPHTAVDGDARVTVAHVQTTTLTAINGINVMLSDTGESMSGDIRFNSGRFDPEDIDRIWAHFVQLLREMLADPSRPIGSYEYVPPEEKALLLRLRRPAGIDESRLVHHVFETWAREAPERVCFRSGEQEIGYGELNARANRIARWLALRLAVQPQQIIGVWMTRSIEMVAAILAIWKCGCAYLPLDPEYPPMRTREILAHARVPIVVGSTASSNADMEIACPPLDLDVLEPADNFDRNVTADQLAYVIYTSGSTGEPKGVMIEHLGMLNHLYAKISDLEVSENSVVVQNASQCFDISVWQFFAAPMAGGRTVIYSGPILLDPRRLTETLIRDRVSILEVVPSYLAALLDNWESGRNIPSFDALEYLVVTGEALTPFLVRRWFDRFPRKTMVNAYGPTEASDDVTHHFIRGYEGEETIPIGAPIQNTRIYLLNRNGQLCPQGIRGEICVSGIGVGRGYLHEPELTSRAFTADPFVDNLRMYRTGDLGIVRRDGTLEFGGRLDSQVKIRGFRIEPGGIERRLCLHPLVRGGAVVVKSDGSGEPYLCAFVELEENGSLVAVESDLRRQLPEYMVPAHFVALNELPLTLNGKINRKRLESAEFPSTEIAAVPPAEYMEQAVVTIWEAVLGRKGVGTLSDFFALGGNSLKALQIIARIRRELGAEVDIETLFAHPTVRELSALVLAAVGSPEGPVESLGGPGRYDIACTQALLLELELSHGASGGFNRNDLFIIRGPLDLISLAHAFQMVVARHESLRTTFVRENGNWRQTIHAVAECPMEFIHNDLRAQTDPQKEAASVAEGRIRQPLKLATGPLVRADLLTTGNDEHMLLLSMSQLISDGRSVEVLLHDLMLFYAGLRNGDVAPPEPLPFQYKDYCRWRNMRVSGARLELDRSFWKQELAGAPAFLPLPAAPCPSTSILNGDRLSIGIDSGLLDRLLAAGRANRATPFVTFLCAVDILLARWTQTEDIVVGAYSRGRSGVDLSDQVGFYLNTLPLRVLVRGGDTVAGMFARVQERVLNAFAHEDYPYEKIRQDLGWVREPNRHPLFDVMVAYDELAELPKPGGLAGLIVESALLPPRAKEADLLFTLRTKTQNGGTIVITWNADLFSQAKVRDLGSQLLQILEFLAAGPDQRVGDALNRSARAGQGHE